MHQDFDPEVFASLIGGRAVIETPRLNLTNRLEAVAYLRTYGYDIEVEADREKLWAIHQRAVNYLHSQLLGADEILPDHLADREQLSDLATLLILASRPDHEAATCGWAGTLLRVMHVIAQLENDLFTDFSLEIQEEITRPYRHFITREDGGTLSLRAADDVICLDRFDIKPFKDSDSAITKLLAKPDEVAFGLMDKIGVRFVTETLYDAFRVMRFLVRHHVVSPANIVASQSNNTLYPTDLFLKEIVNLPVDLSAVEVDRHLQGKLLATQDRRYLEKHNSFTSRDYRFIKFITRQLVRVNHPDRAFSFFYPYEVQILDREHFERSQVGEASHEAYKARQRQRARQRVLPCL